MTTAWSQAWRSPRGCATCCPSSDGRTSHGSGKQRLFYCQESLPGFEHRVRLFIQPGSPMTPTAVEHAWVLPDCSLSSSICRPVGSRVGRRVSHPSFPVAAGSLPHWLRLGSPKLRSPQIPRVWKRFCRRCRPWPSTGPMAVPSIEHQPTEPDRPR